MATYRCSRCKSAFSSKGSLRQHLRAKHPQAYRLRQAVFYGGGALIVAALVLGFVSLISAQRTLPPTSFAGPHVETWPSERISSRPIPIVQQKHIIEHAPGDRPGIILAYNCVKFECDPDLIAQLEGIVRQYSTVYMAPYPEMDAKIALTAQRARLVLEEFDEEKIIEFIQQR
jgi:hypothetical protein